MVRLDVEHLPSNFHAILSIECLESNFSGIYVPFEWQFQVLLHLGEFSYIFSSFVEFHTSGAPLMLTGKTVCLL